MKLLERLSAIEAKITVLGSLDQRRTEVLALQERRERLEVTMRDVDKNASRVRILRSSGLVLTLDLQTIRGLFERVDEVATAFRNKPDSQTLAAKQRWVQLIAALQREAEKLESLADAAWEKFTVDECAAENPLTLEQKLPPTAENAKSLARYRERHLELSTQLRRGAQTAESIAEIRETVAALQTEVAAMQFDYPGDITDFLRAAMAPSGMALSAVTPQLLKWLSEHDMLESYVVRRRN